MIFSFCQKLWTARQHLLLTSAIFVYVSSNSVFGSDSHTKQSAAKMNHNEMNHGSMKHDQVDVSKWPHEPSLTLTAHKDAMAGWNLQIEPNNFEFAQARVNQENVVGEGHAHLYINGEKITRLYSNWYYLNNLPSGVHSVMVVLNANNHGPLILRDQKISATVEILQE